MPSPRHGSQSSLFASALLLGFLCCARSANSANSLAFTSITVIDGTGSSAKPNSTVVIESGRIRQIGAAGRVLIPDGARIVNGAGKFLIPGLWDAHVHIDSLVGANPALADRLARRIQLPLLVANGITSIRDMGTGFELVKGLRKDIAAGAIAGPRIVSPGPPLESGLRQDAPGAIREPADARRAVDALKDGGADFVKVMSLVPRDVFFAIADEARKQGIAFAGHVPESVSASEASDAGERSMEHLLGIWQESSTMSAESKRALVQQTFDPEAPPYVRARLDCDLPPRGIIETLSDEKAAKLYQHLARNRTWQDPTLVEDHAFALMVDKKVMDQDGVRFLPASMKRGWDSPDALKPFDPRDVDDLKKIVPLRLKAVSGMRRHGILFLAGSDTPSLVVPGFALHDELALLVKAGLTPMEALQSATRNPSEFLGLLDSVGTIEAGKLADLVVLDADPLQDIRNTRNIFAVVINGRIYDRPDLDGMLDQVMAEVRANPK